MKTSTWLALCLGFVLVGPCLAADDEDRYPTDRSRDTYPRSDGDRSGRDSRYDDDREDYGRPRFYLGAGPLWAMERFHTGSRVFTGGGPGVSVNADDSFGGEARLGFRLNRFIAFEGQGQYYGSFDTDTRGPGAASSSGYVEGASATGNFKLYPLDRRVQPYLLGGLGLLWLHQANTAPGAQRGNNTELAGRGGIGVDFYLDEHFALNIEGSYLIPASNLKNYPLVATSAGIQYHF